MINKILTQLKGIVAALYPIWKLYHAAKADQNLSPEELQEIGEALLFFAAVYLTPNLAKVRGRLMNVTKVAAQEPAGRHEFRDSDNDGISDAAELRANDPGDLAADQRPAARRLQEQDRTETWGQP